MPSTSENLSDLGDFTTTSRVIPVAGLAIGIGVFAAYVAAGLLKLIGLCTNLFFFQRIDTALVSPAGHHLGPFVVLVPVAGGRHHPPRAPGVVGAVGAVARPGARRRDRAAAGDGLRHR